MTIEGLIDEIMPDGRFGVMLDNEHRIIAYTAGKMRQVPHPLGGRRPGPCRNDALRPVEGPDRLSRADAGPGPCRKAQRLQAIAPLRPKAGGSIPPSEGHFMSDTPVKPYLDFEGRRGGRTTHAARDAVQQPGIPLGPRHAGGPDLRDGHRCKDLRGRELRCDTRTVRQRIGRGQPGGPCTACSPGYRIFDRKIVKADEQDPLPVSTGVDQPLTGSAGTPRTPRASWRPPRRARLLAAEEPAPLDRARPCRRSSSAEVGHRDVVDVLRLVPAHRQVPRHRHAPVPQQRGAHPPVGEVGEADERLAADPQQLARASGRAARRSAASG